MSTIRVRFEPSGFEADAEPGEAIMDITDANPAAQQVGSRITTGMIRSVQVA